MKSDQFDVNPAADKMRGHSKGYCKATHIDQVSSTHAASVSWLQLSESEPMTFITSVI